MKKLRYFLEAVFLGVMLTVFRLLPLDAASATGGWLGRTIGPHLASSRKARRNLENALPELSPEERERIIAGMWNNLGRVIAEYPHLKQIGKERVTFEIDPQCEELLSQDVPCMMVGGHLANWEAGAVSMLYVLGKEVDITYRAPNNPWTDKLLMQARTLGKRLRAYPKSRRGGQDMIKAMRGGRYIGMLVDQKYNEGIAVPFFGHPAMSNPAFVQMSTKFGYPLLPWQVVRSDGARFKIKIYPPLETEGRTTEEVIAEINTYLENWIRQQPEQWLWLHRRWKTFKNSEIKEAG